MHIEVLANADELGAPEQFTWDLLPLVESSQTLHLDQNGLPKVGTQIRPGMILVGKIGKTAKFDPHKQPTALEIQGLDSRELKRKYGPMWNDSSLYATDKMIGVVQQAYVEQTPSGAKAVIELEPESATANQLNTQASVIS